jgi:hypothetical protein
MNEFSDICAMLSEVYGGEYSKKIQVSVTVING